MLSKVKLLCFICADHYYVTQYAIKKKINVIKTAFIDNKKSYTFFYTTIKEITHAAIDSYLCYCVFINMFNLYFRSKVMALKQHNYISLQFYNV